MQQFNGVFVTNGFGAAGVKAIPSRAEVSRSPARIASISDGTSNTALFSELAHGLLFRNDYAPHGSFEEPNWWTLGNLGDPCDSHYWAFDPASGMPLGVTRDQSVWIVA
jgi:hypothetical protein